MSIEDKMRAQFLAAGILVLAGCAAPATQPTELQSNASQPAASPSAVSSPTLTPSPTPTILPTAMESQPEPIRITFQISIAGTVPSDAAFALETTSGGGGGAIYLCSYYGGHDLCESGQTYSETYSFQPGTEVHYRFWRELDLGGSNEEIEEGQLTVGHLDQVVEVDYDFAE